MKLDLHGILHEDVQIKVENFVLLNQDSAPLEIITGNSNRMRDLVGTVLTRIPCDMIDTSQQGKIVVRKV